MLKEILSFILSIMMVTFTGGGETPDTGIYEYLRIAKNDKIIITAWTILIDNEQLYKNEFSGDEKRVI